MDRRSTVPTGGGRHLPPEAIDDPPLGLDAAANLMSRLGFVAFRTRTDDRMPESCLMAIIRDAPTLAHFDPELVTYWAFTDGHGHLESIDADTHLPISRPYSWGTIRLLDRFGMRNSFIGFGGHLTAKEVGDDSRLVIFASPAPLLRLPGHSQRADDLAEEVVTFFARLIPRLWDSAHELLVGTAAPEALYAAFLLHGHSAFGRRPGEVSSGGWWIHRDLDVMTRARPEALRAGHRLLTACGLDPTAGPTSAPR